MFYNMCRECTTTYAVSVLQQTAPHFCGQVKGQEEGQGCQGCHRQAAAQLSLPMGSMIQVHTSSVVLLLILTVRIMVLITELTLMMTMMLKIGIAEDSHNKADITIADDSDYNIRNNQCRMVSEIIAVSTAVRIQYPLTVTVTITTTLQVSICFSRNCHEAVAAVLWGAHVIRRPCDCCIMALR